jgi:CRP/FNR family transcriptional regulator, cyclic AMP receptor protein
MNAEVQGGLTVNYKKNDVVCAAGENIFDLYIVTSGKLLVLVNKGTQMTPLAHIEQDEYLGELSFFDLLPRSAHVVCLEDTTLIRIPDVELSRQMPRWLSTIAKNITTRIRSVDDLIASKGFRKQKADSMAALSIDEQTHYYNILEQYCTEKHLPPLKPKKKNKQ